ncbi:putative copper resistance protein D [Rhizobiales bacterium GAS188]|nr:putative copper resistance protein D [Rhizobiales bacterium GAS188]
MDRVALCLSRRAFVLDRLDDVHDIEVDGHGANGPRSDEANDADDGLRWVILTGLSAAALGSQAWLGHAAIGRGAKLTTELASYIVHVVAAGAWIGGLAPLGELIAARKPISRTAETDHVAALFRFSNVGVAFVSLVFVSGIGNAVFRLASIRHLATTAYGRTILVKAIIFASMVAVAAVNRFVLMPNIEGGGSPSIAAIRCNIVIEQELAALMLGAAAFLGILPPHG